MYDANQVIFVENLVKKFKTRKGWEDIIKSISFSIAEGHIVGFIGPNGAGKTTTIKMLLDLIKPTSGKILFFGNSVNYKGIKEHVGYMSEKDSFYEDMYPLDYLVFLGTLSGLSKEKANESALSLVHMLGLEDAIDKKVKNFSSGMKKKISFAQAILHNPRIVILDEPTANLDPIAQEQLIMVLKEMRGNGATIFISSHNIGELERLIDRVIVLNKGKIILESNLDDLTKKASQGIELSVDNPEAAKNVLIGYNVQNLDNHTLLVGASSEDKSKIVKLLIDAGIQIDSITSKKQNLWDVVLEILKEK